MIQQYPPLMVDELADTVVLHATSHLACIGVMQQRDKYCYLKIDDNFIHFGYPLLTQYGRINRPAYFAPPNDIGAHISIIYPEEETIPKQILGETISFTVDRLVKAKCGAQEYFVLTVFSPVLRKFRQDNQLPAQPIFKSQQIFFHITIGVRT